MSSRDARNASRTAAIIERTLDEAIALHQRVRSLDLGSVAEAGEIMKTAVRSERKIVAFGNGGSAADAQHLVTELVGRFQKERAGFAAVALNAARAQG